MGHYGVREVVVVRCGVLVLLEVPRLATVADGLGWRCAGNDSVVCADFQSVEDTGGDRMNCPLCDGEGFHIQHQDEWGAITTPCQICDGAGKLSLFKWLDLQFWNNAPIWFVEWWGDLKFGR